MAFSLQMPTRILFGRGLFGDAGSEIARIGQRALVVHGASSARRATELPAIGTLQVAGEPDLPGLRDALRTARDMRADVIVALGGGAVLDMGKALAALIPSDSDPLHHLEVVGDGAPLGVDPLPFVAIPTTAGTGAEATKNAVIGVPEAARKVSLRDDRMLARLALVDPALTESAPKGVRLASGLDAVVQVIEPYLSSRANPLTDALCRDAIPRGLRALRRVVEDPDAAAFDDMALVSLTGGIALANAGLGAVHGIAGPMGAVTGAAHGAICGRLLVPVLRANRSRMDGPRAPEVVAMIADAFPGDDPLARFEGWMTEAGLPRLAAMGLSSHDHAPIATAAAESSSMKGNPVALSHDDLLAILSHAA